MQRERATVEILSLLVGKTQIDKRKSGPFIFELQHEFKKKLCPSLQ